MREPLAAPFVVPGEGPRRHCQPGPDPFARLGADTRECGERTERARGIILGFLEVELDDLAPRPGARVAHGDVDLDVLAGPGGIDRLVGPVGVAEAVAKAEQRLRAVAVVPAVTDQQSLLVNEVAGLRVCSQHGGVGLHPWQRNRPMA